MNKNDTSREPFKQKDKNLTHDLIQALFFETSTTMHHEKRLSVFLSAPVVKNVLINMWISPP